MTPSSPAPARAEASANPSAPVIRGASFALAVLFSMNLLNYIDRYVFAGVGPSIIRDLDLTAGQFGILVSAFIFAYTIISPIVGVLGDRYDRRRILAFGVGLWSVATVATAYAHSFNQMFLARAILGIGEASYGIIAPTLLADFFDSKRRGRVMGIFYLALPVGTAIGYGIAGLMEKSGYGWQSAFWVVGAPGLVLALAGLMIREPGRGASDGRTAGTKAPRPKLSDYFPLFRTPSYILNTMGLAAVTFTTGAFGAWIIAYFEYVHKTDHGQKIYFGLGLALAGLVGVAMGMWLPEKLRKLTKRAYMLWAGAAVLLAIPFGTAGLLCTTNTWLSLGLLLVSSVLMSSCLGPCNTVTANVVVSSKRSMGFAASIFLLHLLGDIPSPYLVGVVADHLATPEGMASGVGQFFASIGANPVTKGLDLTKTTNITAGMLLIVPVLLIGSLCFFSRVTHAAQGRRTRKTRQRRRRADADFALTNNATLD